ncbi:uncharacterized protein QC761_0001820 [Podospora bellae-mahoneyi]|uniref:Uncharacterized protein n=1 Tax=Podospora bellae-mahoneyi TaxID=2093777 RepID=A0ABR0FU91_9PEZI|nr:hypothetical protein QC761_0001820 [Podospora bellae-mahoneyi]
MYQNPTKTPVMKLQKIFSCTPDSSTKLSIFPLPRHPISHPGACPNTSQQSSNRCKRHSDISCIDFELGTPTCPPIPDFHKLKRPRFTWTANLHLDHQLAGHITTNRLYSTGTPTPQAPSKPPTAGLVLVDPAAPATSPSVEKTPRSAQRPDTATLPSFQDIYRLLDCCCALCLLSVRLIDLIARTEAELATPDCQAIDNCPDSIPLLTPVSCVL